VRPEIVGDAVVVEQRIIHIQKKNDIMRHVRPAPGSRPKLAPIARCG
jgi:hypothetical protein